MPKGSFWCGRQYTLNFTYDDAKAPAGTMFKVTLSYDSIGKNKVIAELTTVTAPAKEATVMIPEPFPADWLGDSKLKDNKGGGGSDYLFEIFRADNADFTSYCGTFSCNDPSFVMKCCPAADTASCGCAKCSCSTNDVCVAGQMCDQNAGKCIVDLPGAGELCPMGMCDPGSTCQCPTGTTCAATEKVCVSGITCPVGMQTLPGKLNCPCSSPGMMCEAGLACQNYLCKTTSTTPVAGLACTSTQSAKNADSCMNHPLGSAASAPFSCQGGKCAACVVGNTGCICQAGNVCTAQADYCTQAGIALRCLPRTGCLNCPCNIDSSCNDVGAICISGTCSRANTAAPTPPPPTSPAANMCTVPGSKGCPCIMQGTQVGCSAKELVCKKTTMTCDLASANAVSATMALIVTLVVALLN